MFSKQSVKEKLKKIQQAPVLRFLSKIFTFSKKSVNLKPKEKMRYRVQRFLSKKQVIVIFCACLAFLQFFLIAWCFHMLALFIAPLMRGEIPSLSAQMALNALSLVPDWKWFYVILAVAAAILAVRTGFQMVYAFEPLADSNQKGHRRWATLAELKQQYVSIPESWDVSEHPSKDAADEDGALGDLDFPGGVPISRYKNKMLVDTGRVNNLILGMTRSGKGEFLMFPIADINSRVKDLAMKPSLIFSDPKGELAAQAGPTLRARGYEVHVFNLKPPMDGMSYNPLELVKKAYTNFLTLKKEAAETEDSAKRRKLTLTADAEASNAETYARSLAYIINYDPNAKEKIWQEWGTAITTAAIMAVVCDCCEMAQKQLDAKNTEEAQKWYDKITMYSVARFIVDYCNPDPDDANALPVLDQYIMHKTWAARYQYSPVNVADNRTKGNITAEALAKLTQFLLTPIAKLTCKNDLDFEDIGFGKKPVALFLVTPDQDHSNDFILSMLITQLYQSLCRRADTVAGNKCVRKVRFELDEFGNIPPLPHVGSMVSDCLGRNIYFDLVIQSYSQLDATYGKDVAKTIREQCSNQFYLKSNDPETLKTFSSMIGSQTVASVSRFGNPLSLDKNMQESTDTKPLLDESALSELNLGEIVVVRSMMAYKEGKSELPSPIFNYGETRMKPRFEYLKNTFPQKRSFDDLNLAASCTHIDVQLEDIVYDPINQGVVTLDEMKQQRYDPLAKAKARAAAEKQEGPDESPIPDEKTPFFKLLSEKDRRYLAETMKDIVGLSEEQLDAMKSMSLTDINGLLVKQFESGSIDQETHEQVYSELQKLAQKPQDSQKQKQSEEQETPQPN